MAIGYTELDFINGAAPALSAANMNHMDEGIKACADKLDAESTPGRALVEAATVAAQRAALGLGTAALAGDASEGAKGVVQLASVGVPSATKVPKALGADLVALITAAGYTLNPATGTASLDGIADGTTYKRVLAAIATALNAGTFDAATCKAFGIGSTSPASPNADLDLALTAGIFAGHIASFTHYPAGASGHFTLLALPSQSGERASQIFIDHALKKISIRNFISTWGPWDTIWTSSSDGNGGQPPAPKPNSTTGAIGQMVLANSVAGVAYSLPAGGQWFYSAYLFNDTTSIYNGYLSGFAPGGTEILAASVGNIWRGFAWRIS